MDRRKFCASSVSALCVGATRVYSASPRVARYRPVADEVRGVPIGLDDVLFDSRFAASRAFGAAADLAGKSVHALQGDVTALWVQHLRRRWGAGGAVGGMTTPSSLFCLEQLAKDHWMRVVVRIEHSRWPDGRAVHRVTAAEPMMSLTRAALEDARGWPDRLVSTLSACVRSTEPPRIVRFLSGAGLDEPSAAVADLVSWVIAA
jgi:hypothetical protein